MHNPNSAIERIKNHLAYKLGQAMIDFASNGGGYCHLFKKLYEIKKQHKKEQKIYRQTIQVFPQLKYPNLETCSDYEQALRYKFHLSYMLGEVLIKAYQTWYKGGGFKLKNDIKKAKKEFQIFKEILPEIKKLNGKALKAIKDNQQLFLKEFLKIKNILKIHKNYQPILDNIFHNFHYFIQNFDLIEEWLLSNDFNERYKKENHPYPSLLDPKKLNDENEKINYKNIPAELAWDMNLPLPDKYKLVRIAAHCVGGAGTGNMFRACGVYYEWDGWINDGKNVYIKNYYFLLQDKHIYKALDISDYFYKDCIKYFNLIQNDQCYYLICTRDPIEQFKTSFNFPLIHHDRKPNYINLNDLDIYNKLNNVLERVYTFNSNIYSRYDLSYFLEFNLSRICIYTTAIKYFKKAKKLYFLDSKLIDPKVAYNTFKILSKELNFNKPTLDKMAFFSFKSFNTCLAYLFPLTLITNKNIKLIFCTYQNHFMENINYINLKKILSIKDEYFKNIIIYINREDFYKLNNKLILNIEAYCNHIIKVLENIDLTYKKHGVTEKNIIDFCKNNANFRCKVKKIFDKELVYIKQHRPDIVASWKYYQEFEKMCKELDGIN